MKINRTTAVLAGVAASLTISMLLFPNFFFGDKIKKVQEIINQPSPSLVERALEQRELTNAVEKTNTQLKQEFGIRLFCSVFANPRDCLNFQDRAKSNPKLLFSLQAVSGLNLTIFLSDHFGAMDNGIFIDVNASDEKIINSLKIRKK